MSNKTVRPPQDPSELSIEEILAQNEAYERKMVCVQMIAMALAVIIMIFLIFSFFGEGFNENLEDKTAIVVWTEVNCRSKPSTNSKILCTFVKGQKVSLTGKTYEFSDGPDRLWFETSYGWVVAQALQVVD